MNYHVLKKKSVKKQNMLYVLQYSTLLMNMLKNQVFEPDYFKS